MYSPSMKTLVRKAVGSRASRCLVPALALVGVGALSGCSGEVNDRDIKTIPLADAARLHARSVSHPTTALMIDPRPESDYVAGHIPGARNLQLPKVDPDRGTDPAITRYDTLIVYGNNPGSPVARAMAKRLMVAGYSRKRVKWLADGYEAWARAGLPVEQGKEEK